MYNLKPHKDLTDTKLLDFGFRRNCEGYAISKNLYKDIIYVRFEVLEYGDNKSITYSVIDKNTGSLYNPFYNNDMTSNSIGYSNLVVKKVEETLKKFIDKLIESKIVEEEKKEVKTMEDDVLYPFILKRVRNREELSEDNIYAFWYQITQMLYDDVQFNYDDLLIELNNMFVSNDYGDLSNAQMYLYGSLWGVLNFVSELLKGK